MAFDQRSLDDYVDVAERMTEFYDRYPSGSLRAADPAVPFRIVQVQCEWCIQCIGRRQIKAGRDSWKACPRCQGTGLRSAGEPVLDAFIEFTAAAYRQPDDPAPGIGVAWEPYPGRTPYTLGSELMNAETSAWGRAMAALGIATKRGIASRQEVANRRAEREDGLPVNADGSLSRSRTSDDEKERAGVMTSAQQKEHTALRKEPPADVERLTEPDGERWDGPSPLEPLTPLSPRTIDKRQQAQMHAKFTELGIKDRAARLAWTRRALGLAKLESSSDLSYRQAGDLLAALQRAGNGQEAST